MVATMSGTDDDGTTTSGAGISTLSCDNAVTGPNVRVRSSATTDGAGDALSWARPRAAR